MMIIHTWVSEAPDGLFSLLPLPGLQLFAHCQPKAAQDLPHSGTLVALYRHRDSSAPRSRVGLSAESCWGYLSLEHVV